MHRNNNNRRNNANTVDTSDLPDIEIEYDPSLDGPNPVYAVRDGHVFRSGWQNENIHHGEGAGLGYRVSISDATGYDQYGHLDPDTVAVSPGDDVVAGQLIGNYADPTNGSSTGPHLHHERRNLNGQIVNPGTSSPVAPGNMSPTGRSYSSPLLGRGRLTSGYGSIDSAHSTPHQGNDWAY
jgi:hypothetical protein